MPILPTINPTLPQTMNPPAQLNGNAMNNQVTSMKNSGMPTSQSVTKAAQNPNNRFYAKGGDVAPPSKPILEANAANAQANPVNKGLIEKYSSALQGENAIKGLDTSTRPSTPAPITQDKSGGDNQFKQYFDQKGKDYLADRQKMVNGEPKDEYAKGGPVAKKGKMSLKTALEAVEKNPQVMSQAPMGSTNPVGSTQMKKGGAMSTPFMKSEGTSMGSRGLLTMNDDVGSYAMGGDVKPKGYAIGGEVLPDVISGVGDIVGGMFGMPTAGDTAVSMMSKLDGGRTDGEGVEHQLMDGASDEDETKDSGNAQSGVSGILKMAGGGSMEEDSVQSYGPDGMPIVENQDGSSGDGDVNQLLGRPESASILGTGADPANETSSNAANAVGNGTATNMMKSGGEEAGPPPGSLKKEVADDVPAQLSEGEFVMSADTTRFYGLRLLTMMQDHARMQLEQMNGTGDIRHPGDGKNPDQEGFHQDAQPDTDAYADKPPMDDSNEPSEITGLLKECQGGMNMATGGGLGEEQSLAKGGSVTSMGPSLTPKKFENGIPMGKSKLPGIKDPFNNTNKLPKMATGGLLNDINTVPQQSTISS